MTSRRLWALLVVAAAVVLFPARADAHAVLEGTAPADGEVLAAAPTEVTLQFNEIVAPLDGGITILGPDGQPVEIGDVHVVDTTVLVPLPPLDGEGSYVVSWRVVSSDSHPLSGAFVFSVGAPSSGPNPVEPPADGARPGLDVLRALVTFAAYLGVLVAVGLTIFTAFVHDEGDEKRRLARLAFGAGVLGAVGVVAALPIHIVDLAGDGLAGLGQATVWTDVVTGAVGVAAMVTLVGLTALLVGSRCNHRGAVVVMLTGAALALGGFVVTGHTRTFGPPWLVISADLVHLAAGAVWLGGVIGLVVTLRSRHNHDDAGPTAAIITRFSTLAAIALVAAAGVGVVMAWRILGSWRALIETSYGTTLLVKVGLVVVVAALGGYNRVRLMPRLAAEPSGGRARIARVVRVEAVLLVAVVAVTALLVDRSPVASATPDQPPTTTTSGAQPATVLDVDLGDMTARVVVEPARTGTNSLVIFLVAKDGNPVDALDAPIIELNERALGVGPISYATERSDQGTYAADVEVPVPGNWELRLTVRMSTFDKPIGVTTLTVDP